MALIRVVKHSEPGLRVEIDRKTKASNSVIPDLSKIPLRRGSGITMSFRGEAEKSWLQVAELKISPPAFSGVEMTETRSPVIGTQPLARE
ncbi:MAG: hypothetical protein CVU64_11360 [Deltaproteobacteria bacterium HGW-Deltaproteobacteria-21]|nr:MAG: hypothetical protein CVU64_11360 [Deltaproteobacteria bacterium HGW-Deltaproteobacteria-21]